MTRPCLRRRRGSVVDPVDGELCEGDRRCVSWAKPGCSGVFEAFRIGVSSSAYGEGNCGWSVGRAAGESRVAGTFGSLLDVAVSTRSTYSGGPVASVVAPVTVGMNQDKTGYELSAEGIDQIMVETGVNARQALSPILAAVAGTLSGAGTGSVVIKGGMSARHGFWRRRTRREIGRRFRWSYQPDMRGEHVELSCSNVFSSFVLWDGRNGRTGVWIWIGWFGGCA